MSTQTIHLNPVDPETDYARLAELITEDSGEPVTVERLRDSYQCPARGTVRLQVVATAASRRILGYAEIVHERAMPTGHFHLRVIVDREQRGRGIGGMLYDDLLLFAREQGGTHLSSDVLRGAAEGLRFATRRGFTVGGEEPECPSYYRLVRDLP